MGIRGQSNVKLLRSTTAKLEASAPVEFSEEELARAREVRLAMLRLSKWDRYERGARLRLQYTLPGRQGSWRGYLEEHYAKDTVGRIDRFIRSLSATQDSKQGTNLGEAFNVEYKLHVRAKRSKLGPYELDITYPSLGQDSSVDGRQHTEFSMDSIPGALLLGVIDLLVERKLI
jgi:hypothetical protein